MDEVFWEGKNFFVLQPDLYLLHSGGPEVVPVGLGWRTHESAFLTPTKEAQ